MYAHVNVWTLTDRGAAWKDDAAKAIAARLRDQPGFHSYTVIRTGEWELVVVTVFDTAEELERAIEAVGPTVREHIVPLVEPRPEKRQGAVLLHVPAPRRAEAA